MNVHQVQPSFILMFILTEKITVLFFFFFQYKQTVSLCSVRVHSINVFTILCMQVNLKKNHSFIAVRVICCEKRQVTSLSSPDEWYMSFQAKTERLSDS